MLGLRYSKFTDGKYNETGTGRRNLIVAKKSTNKIEGVVGSRMSFISQLNDGLLIPEIHGFVSYNFKNKAPKIDARLDGALTPMPVKTSKSTKTQVNLGTSITLKHRLMEYSLGYDANFANKYISHQGSLKLRLNF
jgi:outer membrane autotransporter protein